MKATGQNQGVEIAVYASFGRQHARAVIGHGEEKMQTCNERSNRNPHTYARACGAKQNKGGCREERTHADQPQNAGEAQALPRPVPSEVVNDAEQYKDDHAPGGTHEPLSGRSEEHTSELQSLMRISYAVFCLNKK